MDKIIIVGQGIVGQATWEYLSTAAKISNGSIEFHDPSLRSFAKTWTEANWCFICVNTDLDAQQDKNDDSRVFDAVNESTSRGFGGIYVLRSTVSLTTIDTLTKMLGERIVVWPEFVREKFWQTDCLTPQVMPIGGKRAGELCKLLAEPKIAKIMSAHESMACKLSINGFLATKVTFFNGLNQLCDKTNMDFDTILSTVKEFPGIGSKHTEVPGPDGQLGYGGKCLPKDTRTLAHDIGYYGGDPDVIKAVVNFNSRLRNV